MVLGDYMTCCVLNWGYLGARQVPYLLYYSSGLPYFKKHFEIIPNLEIESKGPLPIPYLNYLKTNPFCFFQSIYTILTFRI